MFFLGEIMCYFAFPNILTTFLAIYCQFGQFNGVYLVHEIFFWQDLHVFSWVTVFGTNLSGERKLSFSRSAHCAVYILITQQFVTLK